jgi:hypothetical protein
MLLEPVRNLNQEGKLQVLLVGRAPFHALSVELD